MPKFSIDARARCEASYTEVIEAESREEAWDIARAELDKHRAHEIMDVDIQITEVEE